MTFSFVLFTVMFTCSLALTLFGIRMLLPVLEKRHVGQKILEIGPQWHKSKEGTPTMGGIAFIVATSVLFCVFTFILRDGADVGKWNRMFLVFGYALLNAMIGCIDDATKLKKEENKGLTPWQKLALQGASSILFLYFWARLNEDTFLTLPFTKLTFGGVIYFAVSFFLLCGMVNSVNLTDGVDGLAGSVTLVCSVFFAVVGIFAKDLPLEMTGALLIGACVGFLYYNVHPAAIFMGDTGSLFFGGMIASLGFYLGNPLLALLYGFPYLIEALSVILQVGYFKISGGKRLFLMAPYHHHLEKKGMSENRVDVVFCVLAVFGFALAVLAYLGGRA